MKKILAIIMVVSVIFAFVGCSSKKYEDKLVTVAVTDENGEEVTDENGNVVTEVLQTTEEDKQSSKNDDSTSATSENTTKKSNGSNKTSDTTKKADKTTAKTTTKKTAEKTTEKTTEETTKAKKRQVSVVVKYPYYNAKKTTVTVAYKLEGDKEYTKLDPQVIILDKVQTVTYDLGKLKGKVSVVVNIKGVTVTPGTNKGVIEANENTLNLDISTGIEVIDVFE